MPKPSGIVAMKSVTALLASGRTWYGASRCQAALSVPIRVGLLDRPTGECITFQCARRLGHVSLHTTPIVGHSVEQWRWDDEAAEDMSRMEVWPLA